VTIVLGLENLNEFGSPLPNAGGGVRGEGARTPLDLFAEVSRAASRAGFRELIRQRGIPLTPQPLSRVGARGADFGDYVRIRTESRISGTAGHPKSPTKSIRVRHSRGSLGFPHSRILYSAHASASTRLAWAGPSPGGNLSGQALEIRR